MCCCLNATGSRYKYVCICGTAGISARDKEISTSDYNPLSVAWDSVTATRADARDETGPLARTRVPRWIIHTIWTSDDVLTFGIVLTIKTVILSGIAILSLYGHSQYLIINLNVLINIRGLIWFDWNLGYISEKDSTQCTILQCVLNEIKSILSVLTCKTIDEMIYTYLFP